MSFCFIRPSLLCGLITCGAANRPVRALSVGDRSAYIEAGRRLRNGAALCIWRV
jgi:hypothetical protein